MPNYLKSTKIELWKSSVWQDEVGAAHEGRPRQVATFWACLKGRNNAIVHDNTGEWAPHAIDFTLTRPKWQKPELGDHVKHAGKFYRVTAINDLTGQWGRDMRITAEADPNYGLDLD